MPEPSEVAGDHEKPIVLSPAVAEGAPGWLGTMSIMTGPDDAGSEAPASLWAITSKVCSTPSLRSEMTHWEPTGQSVESPWVRSRTVNLVKGEPLGEPFVHLTTALFLLRTSAVTLETLSGWDRTASLIVPVTARLGSPEPSMTWKRTTTSPCASGEVVTVTALPAAVAVALPETTVGAPWMDSGLFGNGLVAWAATSIFVVLPALTVCVISPTWTSGFFVLTICTGRLPLVSACPSLTVTPIDPRGPGSAPGSAVKVITEPEIFASTPLTLLVIL